MTLPVSMLHVRPIHCLWQVLVMNSTSRGTIELDDGVGTARRVRGSYSYHSAQPGLATDSVDAIIAALRGRYGNALVRRLPTCHAWCLAARFRALAHLEFTGAAVRADRPSVGPGKPDGDTLASFGRGSLRCCAPWARARAAAPVTG